MAHKKLITVLVFICFFLSFNFISFSSEGNIVIYGDSRHNHKIHRLIVGSILKFKPAIVFHTGDMVDNGLNPLDWQAFNKTAHELLTGAEFFPVIGNHEKGSFQYFLNFNLPYNRRWYALEREGIHFTVLDSTISLKPGSAQYKWLEDDLRNISGKIKFKIVILHEPLFSVGRYHEDKNNLRPTLLPLFEKYKVNAVFSGDDHNYQHFLYQGIHFVVTAGGGAPLYQQKAQSPYLQKFLAVYHFCVLTPENEDLTVKVFDINSNPVDEFKIIASSAKIENTPQSLSPAAR